MGDREGDAMTFNKRNANYILAAVALLFLLFVVIKYFYPNVFTIKLFYFIFEAALVGGIADWFAVTALFKKPFPEFIPQPHTALIPSNRGKVIDAVVVMVENELLSKEIIKAKIKQINIVDYVVLLLEDEKNTKQLTKFITGYVQKFLEELDPGETAIYLEKLLKTTSAKIDLTPHLRNIADWVIEKDEDDKWLGYLLDELIDSVKKESTHAKIHEILLETKEEKIGENVFLQGLAFIAEKLNALNMADAARAVQAELIATLQELKDPRHILRKKVKVIINNTIIDLDKRDAWKSAIEAWKEGVIERVNLKEVIETLIFSAVKVAFINMDEDAPLMKWVVGELKKYIKHIRKEEGLKAWLDKYLKEAINSVVDSEHHLVGSIARETLNAFTNTRLNEFVEDKVGSDLQGIRINGCIVGSIVGACIFLFLNFVYDPYFVPMILKIMG